MIIYVWYAGDRRWYCRPADETIYPEGGEGDALYQELLIDPDVEHVEAEI